MSWMCCLKESSSSCTPLSEGSSTAAPLPPRAPAPPDAPWGVPTVTPLVWPLTGAMLPCASSVWSDSKAAFFGRTARVVDRNVLFSRLLPMMMARASMALRRMVSFMALVLNVIWSVFEPVPVFTSGCPAGHSIVTASMGSITLKLMAASYSSPTLSAVIRAIWLSLRDGDMSEREGGREGESGVRMTGRVVS